MDLLLGTLMALLGNIHRDPKKRSAPFTASDFIPNWLGDSESDRDRLQQNLGQSIDAWIAFARQERQRQEKREQKRGGNHNR